MSLSTYLTVSTKKTAFLIRCPDELLGEKGWNWLFPPEALGLTLGFWQGGCASESKPEPGSALGLSPPLHMADPTQGVQTPDLEFSSQRSSLTFPGSKPQFHSLYVTCLLALVEGNNIIKKPQPVTIQKSAMLSQEHSALHSREEDN